MPGDPDFGKDFVAQEVEDEVKEVTQTPSAVPPGFDQAPTSFAKSILQTESLTSSPLTAKSILASEGVSSSKQLLDSMKVPTAKDIIAGAGVTNASQILEKEKIKKDAAIAFQKEMQEKAEQEAYYQKQEQEFLRNYKFDPADFNPTQYDTKYGVIDFKDMVYSNGAHFSDPSINLNVTLMLTDPNTGEAYHFLPEKFISGGAKNPTNNAQMYNSAFLKRETLNKIVDYGQYIDLSETDFSFLEKGVGEISPQSFRKTDYYTEEFKDALGTTFYKPTEENLANLNKGATTVKNVLGSKGFVFSDKDWTEFNNTYLQGNYHKWGSKNNYYGTVYGGDILGMAEKDGQLIYVTQAGDPRAYGYDALSSWINSDGSSQYYWYKKPKRKKDFFSKIVYGVGDIFNAVPFGAELLVIATGGAAAPYYPAIKGAQTVAAGGDLGQTITSMAIAALPQTGVMKGVTDATTKYLTTNFLLEAATAQVVSSAIISAGFNGSIAALTGQDVEKAVIAGAITGGIQAGVPAVAKEVFKGVDVSGIAKTLNLNEKQFQNILVASVGNAAISSAVYKRDFFDSFSQTLITSGLSQAAANKVASQFSATADKKQVEYAVKLTQATVNAGARSAIRGTDFDQELQRSFQGLVSKEVMDQTKKALAPKK